MWSKEKSSTDQIKMAANTSFFAAGFKILGDIESENDICVEGEIHGNVKTTKKVVVGKTGKILGNINAKDLCVHGLVEGEVTISDLAKITPTGVVSGIIVTKSIQIEPGADVEATLKKISGNKRGEANSPDQANEKKESNENTPMIMKGKKGNFQYKMGVNAL
ncbi:bactofilin family protein [Pleomorphovibrio marinus]|uniref:bactofilin family protein n=1 Tax=Pleomorphovibrio marinus TaxID=2164132 RepID=UPI000E0A4C83|nr:polymer-forming cytoskeletal protein [Pleomorphovibrio marinus]